MSKINSKTKELLETINAADSKLVTCLEVLQRDSLGTVKFRIEAIDETLDTIQEMSAAFYGAPAKDVASMSSHAMDNKNNLEGSVRSLLELFRDELAQKD